MGHQQDQKQISTARYRQRNDRGIDHRHREKPQGAEAHEPVQSMAPTGILHRLDRLPGGLMFAGCLIHIPLDAEVCLGDALPYI